ncbi:preprotein translocase subunit SecY [Steroidobacter sp.]|uniref:preprotein translocase subunit SecY n=1 Tax=Steroidobacter sp. TaxID=1978227 RepID=UPI001A60A89B|nr:preprotein translocase subunit SecY [Steroidobacter sp.]MBL8269885.1 preprotein translocase subunit SecY [Steroidobacter sp.]
MTRFAELRQRLFFLLGALIVYRIGTFIPAPGIDPVALARFFEQQQGTILDIFNMFSGGALERLSIFALGVMPYISASIIIQMMAVVVPSLAAIKKEGESGRRKLTQYTRYGTVLLAAVQGASAAIAFQNQGVVVNPGPQFVFVATMTLIAGTMFLMWLGEQITERGLGNGISMIILAGIVAGLPAAIGGTLELVRTGEINAAVALVLFAMVIGVTAFVVFVERGQRRIQVNYAKRQQGRRLYAGQSTHLPFKLNMSGVIPPIFASSLLLFPATIASWGGSSGNFSWMQNVSAALTPGQPAHMVLYGGLIIFFCFFYTALVFNSRETAENLKKSGAFIPGIRPGQQTGEYIDKVLTRLTVWGALYVTIVCLLPEFLISRFSVPFYFGGTSLLIMVVVIMDFQAQVAAHLMSHQYEGLMKKANLRGYNRPGSTS